MVFAALALYFLAMVAIAAVLLLPSVRERCVAAARAVAPADGGRDDGRSALGRDPA